MTILYIILGVITAIILWAVWAYNNFVTLTNRTKEAWSDIDVQLKRRYDLIPNLINAVKGYMKHEKGTFEKVTEMRVKAMGAEGTANKGMAENMLTDALKSLFAVAENYPDLKANENFVELQRELTDTENKIQASRRFYNTNVRDLNIGLESFPQSIIGNMFKFQAQEFFELDESESKAARKPVEVKF
jgi:LemA protein|tara:strand:+ start:22555 stop:23118 length:564 start_codon:yes stop_codon:yes gene_type:complete